MKTKTIFVCSSCGYESPKWLGKCPGCNEWNSFYEEKDVNKTGTKDKKKERTDPVKLKEIEKKDSVRIKTGIEELDRVLRWRICKRLFNTFAVENQELENQL